VLSATSGTQPSVLFPDLADARFDYVDMDSAYQDGIEDLADKVVHLIQQSDFEITLEEIIEFLEHEKEGV
jgi:hypothetical protein